MDSELLKTLMGLKMPIIIMSSDDEDDSENSSLLKALIEKESNKREIVPYVA